MCSRHGKTWANVSWFGSLLPAAVSPVVPSLGSNDVRYVAVDEDDSGVGTPRASQVDGSTACDCAAHEREACTGVACSLLRCYRSASRVGYGVQLTILRIEQNTKALILVQGSLLKRCLIVQFVTKMI